MGFMSVENDSDLMQEGEYEVYVQDCCETKTKTSGRECIKFDFVVRSDVEQKYKNKHIFKNFYRDQKTGEWPNEKIGKYANALGIEKGMEFDLDELIGRNCRLAIRHFIGDDGVKREAINGAKVTLCQRTHDCCIWNCCMYSIELDGRRTCE